MQVLVQTFHDVRERIHVDNFRLIPKELGKTLQVREILRIADAATFLCRDGVLDRVHAKVLQCLVGVTPEFHALIKVPGPLVVEGGRRNECG